MNSENPNTDPMAPVDLNGKPLQDREPTVKTNLAFRQKIRNRRKSNLIGYSTFFGAAVLIAATAVILNPEWLSTKETEKPTAQKAPLRDKQENARPGDPPPTSLIDAATEDSTISQPIKRADSNPRLEASISNPAAFDIDGANPTVDQTSEPLTAQQREQLGNHLENAKAAIGLREFDQARRLIHRARKLDSSGQFSGPIDRLGLLNEYVQGFWNAVAKGTEGIEGEELEINGTRVYVIEQTDQHLLLRVNGENRRYSLTNPSSKLALFLADRWFDQSVPSTAVFKGAYMFVHEDFTNDQVQELWTEAIEQGASIGDLEKVLHDSYDF